MCCSRYLKTEDMESRLYTLVTLLRIAYPFELKLDVSPLYVNEKGGVGICISKHTYYKTVEKILLCVFCVLKWFIQVTLP